jgi:uncharacterized protein involved in exopolysaccharide biosynthesis
MIRVEDQQIPENLIQSTITDYAEERVRKIGQEILSRPKLLAIIDRFDLYPDLKDKKTPTELVKKMRKDIDLETIEAFTRGRDGGKSTTAMVAFTLSYEGKDPVKVYKVTDTLSKLYLEEDIKTRAKFISGTTEFLQTEMQRLEKEINDHEKNISNFKQNHLRELPEDRGYNLSVIARLERSLDQLDMRLQKLKEQRVMLQSRLTNVEPLTPIVIDGEDLAINPAQRLKRLRLELMRMQSVYSEKHPNIKNKKREIARLEKKVRGSDDSVEKIKKLRQLEIRLAASNAKFGSQHPDVKALKREIAILRRQVDSLVTEDVQLKISEEMPDNPIYITLKIQLETIDMEIRNLMEEKPQLIAEIDEYQRRIEKAPIVERELNALTRDYENLKRKYSEISNKLMNAQLAQQMEGKEKGERFNITSPAYLPQDPNKQDKRMIIALSFVLAFGISTLLVAFQEGLDASIKTSNQLKQLTNIPVLSTISYIETEKEKRQHRIKNLIWTGAALGCVGLALLIVNLFVMKLDLVWEVVVERIMMIA